VLHKFRFWRNLKSYDFEGWRNRPKYKLIIMAQPCGDCEQLRKKNSESLRGSSFRAFSLYMDKGIRLWTYAQPEQKNDKNSSISS
jgi:hypothetical protein